MSAQFRRVALGLATAVATAAAWTLPLGARPAAQTSATPADPALLAEFEWRSIGPDRGGRSLTVAGVVGRPAEGYFGAVGGGLWKTTDSGETWAPVTDGQITSSSVGAVAVAETNPDIVFIGTGEACIRGNIQPGDGVYKSTDAGRTWTHVGLRETQNVSKVRIHPTDPNVVFVAAFGHHGEDNPERGVFKSTDGGASWRKVLYHDEKTGAADLWIDHNNPDVIYAALWQAYRVEYQMSSGGPGSGLYKSTDGGETWTNLTRNPGLPTEGAIGRIGVTVSGADSNRVYALVENDHGGLFVSDDAGATWTLVNSERQIRQRAFYYTHLTADPRNRDLVYVLNVGTFISTDGGKTIARFAGGDSHDLWIDPNDPDHVMHASDSGGAITYDASSPQRSWTARDYPTAQYYHAVTTAHVPYHVCGAQQDGPTVCLPNETGGGRGFGRGGRGGGTPETYSPGGAEPAYIAPDPNDPDVFFSGGNNGTFLIYTNRKTGQQREIHPYPRMFSGEPSSALVERVQWTFPIVFSPIDPSVLYTATQHVWRTTSKGQTWDRISPDLTTHDPETMGHSGGPITGDMNGPEIYATVFALAPSKLDLNVIWAGSDDGLIHVTRDGGRNWTAVTPPDMPEFGRVSIIDASAFDAGTAYAAVKRPLMGDQSPYLFRTHDFGQTWQRVVSGLRPDDYVHTVREDPTRRHLLYAGTQHGVYYSYDDGDHWHPLSLNLPDVQISDLIVEETDLVIATHGRSFYVLDDIGPIRQFGADAASADAVQLFAPDAAYRSTQGLTIQYWVTRPVPDLTIEIVDPAGTVVQTIEAQPAGGRGGRGAGQAGGGRGAGRGGGGRGGFGGGGGSASTAPGLQSVSWNLRYPSATGFPGMILWGASLNGPAAAPGTYQVRLTAEGRTQTKPFEVRRHPLHTDITDADLRAQFNLAIRIRDKVTEANETVIQIRRIKGDLDDRLGRSTDGRLQEAAGRLRTNMSAVEEAVYQVRNESGQDPLNFPIKINNRLASLLSSVNRGDGAPIGNAESIFNDLVGELAVQTDRLTAVLDADLAAFNAEARRLGLEPIGR